MITSEQNEARILDLVRGRQLAKLTVELIGPELTERATPAFAEGFTTALRNSIMGEEPPPASPAEPPPPIARLGATQMPFGEHVDRTFDETPLAYLEWLCREQETFYKLLRQYLRHPELESRRRGLERGGDDDTD